MRIADIVFRQGHLSDDTLIETVMTGARHDHLDQCAPCRQRALELGRWLDEVRAVAVDAADEAFPPETLTRQQAQILRRLEQLDEPPRVITFPAQTVGAPRTEMGRRIAPVWLGVAAAAGLAIGVVGGQMSARMTIQAPEQSQQTPVIATPQDVEPTNASLLDYDLDRYVPDALLAVDQLTPTPTLYVP